MLRLGGLVGAKRTFNHWEKSMEKFSAAPVQMRQMIELAYLAGGIMKTYFTHHGMERIVKTDTTPLTAADTEINDLVVDHIRKLSSDIDIIGEERSDRTNNPWQIMCDPVDGTFPYSWGMPVSTFMLGLSYEREPVAGVIYDPFTDRLYYAEKGVGAWMRTGGKDHLLTVSKVTRKDRPIIGYCSWPGSPYHIMRTCVLLEELGYTMINLCSIGYIEVAVANGEFAATLFPGTKHHDTAPGHIIVEEARGVVTDVFGKPLHYTDNKIAGHIMSNGLVHDDIVRAVAACQ